MGPSFDQNKVSAVIEEKTKEKSKRSSFMNFLASGGILIIIFAAVGIFILISYLTR